MSTMNELIDYVQAHAIRGTCTCGECIDHPGTASQPTGHTADLVFFKVANNGGIADELRQLVASVNDGAFCSVDVFDGKEHGYMELGGWIGDQGLAMMLMGLGAVLGIWVLLTPKTLGLSDDMALQMAGMGMVTIIAEKLDTPAAQE